MKETHPASVRSLLLSVLMLSSTAFQAQAYYHPDEGRWISRDPIGEEGFQLLFLLSQSVATELGAIERSGDEVSERKDALFRDFLNLLAEPNSYAFAWQNPANLIDYLGLLSPGFGAGKVCVESDCAGVDLSLLKYLPEKNPPYTLLPMPTPGACVDADAFYATGVWAKKIPDNGKLTVECDCGAIDNFGYIKWPWWIGDTIDWHAGDPRPPGFPAPWPAP